MSHGKTNEWGYARGAVHASIRDGRFEEFLRNVHKEDLSRPAATGFSIVTDAALTREPAALEALLRAGAELDVFGATTWNRADLVRSIVSSNPAEMERVLWCGTPLDWAVHFDHLEIAELLLELGYPRRVRILSYADETIRWAVAHGADPNEEHLLHHQAKHGRPRGVATLLKLGADPNLPDQDGNTPLHLLARTGVGKDLARLLLDAGARTDIVNTSGLTPVDVARSAKRRTLYELLRSL
jgi:hypothetical protein